MSNYPAGVGNYFEEEAEELREQEIKWKRIIGDIGEGPFYEIDGYYLGKEYAVEALNEEFGEGEYEIDDWEVEDDEVYANFFGGY